MKEKKHPMTLYQPITCPNQFTKMYSGWFENKINDYADQHRDRFQPRELFKAQNGLFVTISFDHNARSSRLRSTASIDDDGHSLSELDRFSDLYNRVCRMVIGRNYHRASHRDSLPLAIACMDVNGTRYWKTMGEIENAHIHSIWFGNNQTGPRLKSIFADQEWLKALQTTHSIRNIDVQTIREATTAHLTGYTAKLIGHNNRDLAMGEDFRIWPREQVV